MRTFHEDGASGLWSGTLPSLALVSNPAIKFTAYEWLKRKLAEVTGQVVDFGVFKACPLSFPT